MASVSKTFSAPGDGPDFRVEPGETIEAEISGTFTGTLISERSTDGGQTFEGLDAAMYLGKDWNRADMQGEALAFWDGRIDWEEFKKELVK